MNRRKFLQVSAASSIAIPFLNFPLKDGEKSNTIVQEVYLDIKGEVTPLYHIIKGNIVSVPIYGFNKEGKVISRSTGAKGGYAPLKQEWIDRDIIKIAKTARLGSPILGDPRDYMVVTGYKDAIPDDKPIYVMVIRRSNAPNEIGIVAASEPIHIEDSSATIINKNRYKFGEKMTC